MADRVRPPQESLWRDFIKSAETIEAKLKTSDIPRDAETKFLAIQKTAEDIRAVVAGAYIAQAKVVCKQALAALVVAFKNTLDGGEGASCRVEAVALSNVDLEDPAKGFIASMLAKDSDLYIETCKWCSDCRSLMNGIAANLPVLANGSFDGSLIDPGLIELGRVLNLNARRPHEQVWLGRWPSHWWHSVCQIPIFSWPIRHA